MACIDKDKGSECTYELRPLGTGAFSVTRARSRTPLNVGNPPSQVSANVSYTARISPPRDLPLLIWPDSSEPAPPLPAPHKQPPADASVVQNVPGTMERIPCPTVFPLIVLPSTHFQTVPRPLRPPLSLIPPEHLQVSGVAPSDLDMKLYVLFQVS